MSSIALASHLSLWALLVLTWFILLGVFQKMSLLAWRLDQLDAVTPRRVGRDGVAIGAAAPDFELKDQFGRTIGLSGLVGNDVILVFTQPGCGPCEDILPELVSIQKKRGLHVLLISSGEPDEVRSWATLHANGLPVLRQ